jgi:hypothetical protein
VEEVGCFGRRQTASLGAIVALGGDLAVGVVLLVARVFFVLVVVLLFVIFVGVAVAVGRRWMRGHERARVRGTGDMTVISIWQETTDVLLEVRVLLEFFIICII